jgi:hypothetical protein
MLINILDISVRIGYGFVRQNILSLHCLMDHCTTHIISQGYGKGGKVLFPKQ